MRFSKRILFGLFIFLIFFAGNNIGLKAEQNPGGNRQSLERLEVEGTEVYRRFGSGEKIKLRVTYMGLTAGYIDINTEKTTFENRPVYRLKMEAETKGTVSWMYSVKDTLISYMDIRGLFSWGYDYHKNHNGEKETEKVRYQQDEGFVVRNGEKGGGIPLYTQDVLSAVYYLRARNIEVGEEYTFPVHVDDDVYTLILEVRKLEQIITDSGWQEAFKIVPRLESEQREKELQEKLKDSSRGVRVWISNDERRIPLQIAIPAQIGSLYGYLNSYEPGEKLD
ncbi:MAG: DUF3108 domain-containing protein [bacterium]